MEVASCGMWGVRQGSIGKVCDFAILPGPAYLAAGPFIMGCSRQVFLFDTKKEPKKCPLLPIAREARLRGCSPLRTPIMWSEDGKAKKRRSAAFFLTLFRPLPFDPSGAKCNLRLPAAQRPPCVKGAVTEGDWGIVTLPIHRLSLARSQSLRHGCRRATSLYTREAFWLS